MQIVLEGPDGSGKSTLARYIAQRLGYPIIASAGPEKFPGEINDRIRRWIADYHNQKVIFDRHPVVSQTIYGRFRKGYEVDPILEEAFYKLPILFIYCRGWPTIGQHELKSHDTHLHLTMINDHHPEISELYDKWAVEHAHIIRRPRENLSHTFNLISGAIGEPL